MCLSEIFQEVNVRDVMLHHDNASFHVARLTIEFLKQTHVKMIEHLSYSHDLTMCNLWLYFNLKKFM